MIFRKKPVEVEAITFDELVAYGITVNEINKGNIINGRAWSFFYKEHPITHESDDCYLIPTLEGVMKLQRGDMLITGVKGEIYPCKKDVFEATYDLATDEAKQNEATAEPLEREIIFYAQEGLSFTRIVGGPRHGSVKVKVVIASTEEHIYLLNASEWASVMASMTCLGETGATFRMFEALQKG